MANSGLSFGAPTGPTSLMQSLMEAATQPTARMPSSGIAAGLKLTPREMYLYEHHVGNTLTKPVKNKDGSTSTVLQRVVNGPGGLYYNIPSVWDGQILGEDAAVKRAAAVGWDKWPAYSTPDQADARYEQMHRYMEQDVP